MRQPKPWQRKQTGTWYAQIDGRQVKLGRTEAAANRKLEKLLAGEETADSNKPLVVLLDDYLEHLRLNKSAATYNKARYHLRRFAARIQRMKASKLKPYHVQKWIDTDYAVGQKNELPTSETYKHTAISVVKSALNWLAKSGYIPKSPLKGMEMPTPTVRQFFVPADRWPDLLAAIRDQPFKDYVSFLLATGCRAQEIRAIEARHFSDRRIVFAIKESKGKKGSRVIWLNDEALAIVQRLAKAHPAGPIFRDTAGEEWNKDSVKCRFQRLQHKLKMPGLCATALRHSYAHHKLVTGTDSLLVSKLLGHVNGEMLAERYGHANESAELMLRAATNAAVPIVASDVPVVLQSGPSQPA